MDLHLKDIVELKKIHPCGSKQWEITRVGMDIKLKCCLLYTLTLPTNSSV